jgi:hypothetical protein
MAKKAVRQLTVARKPTNDWDSFVEQSEPWRAAVTIQGTADLFFNRWSVEMQEGVEDRPKGAKLQGDPELCVYRDSDGNLSVTAEMVRMAMVNAGKFFKSPQNPRASLVQLLKAGLIVTPPMLSLGTDHWDYLDKRRVRIPRGGSINKTRPVMALGWTVSFEVENLIPEYVTATRLNEVIAKAGRFFGVGDFRPTYGRFQVTKFELIEHEQG